VHRARQEPNAKPLAARATQAAEHRAVERVPCLDRRAAALKTDPDQADNAPSRSPRPRARSSDRADRDIKRQDAAATVSIMR
jgi:hypothetical protein